MAMSLEMKVNTRVIAAAMGLFVGVIFIALCTKLFQGDEVHKNFVLAVEGNRDDPVLPIPYPFSIQNIMWADVLHRLRRDLDALASSGSRSSTDERQTAA